MIKSSGTTHVSLNWRRAENTVGTINEAEEMNLDIFKSTGSYALELKVCRSVPHTARRRRAVVKRNLDSGQNFEDGLLATYNESKCSA